MLPRHDLGWLNRGKEYGMKAMDIFKETILSEFKGIADDLGGELSSITNYDTSDIKGLLDNIDKDKIKKLVEKARPLISEYYDKAQKMAMDIFEQGKEEFDKIREEVESEVRVSCTVLKAITLANHHDTIRTQGSVICEWQKAQDNLCEPITVGVYLTTTSVRR